jgi:hypothetical protein
MSEGDTEGGSGGGGESGGGTEVEIDREDNFRALWANAYAEFGPANTTMDFLASLEGKIVGTLAFATSAVGVQIDTCLGAMGVEVDAGNSFGMHGIHLRNSEVELEAVCNEAEAALSKASANVIATHSDVNKLKSTVDYLESGGAWLNAMAMIAKV